jgi:oxygen-dependent protoporphyrinogen oxidase
MEEHEILVLGGGITGLACAWRLQQAGLDVHLLEARSELGGNLRTISENGFVMERGPHSFMASATDLFDLADEVGALGSLVPTRKEARDRFIVRSGRLHKAPLGPWSFLSTRLLSLGSKIRLASEPFRTRRRGHNEDTAADFFERRFGPEAARIIAGAFICGVYAGDPDKLSARAAFPLFWGFEQESGSMIRGAMHLGKKRKAERRAKNLPAKNPRQGLYTFKQGLGHLSHCVARRLGSRCTTNAPADRVSLSQAGFVVHSKQREYRCRRLVVATPPGPAAALLKNMDADTSRLLASIPMAKVVQVHLGFSQRLPEVPEGFGFLAPPDQGVRSLGVLFCSRLAQGRAPQDGDLLCAFLGGMLDPGAIDLSDQTLISEVLADLDRLLGLSVQPSFLKVVRHAEAIPQLTLGHLERMEEIASNLLRHPGLVLAGNYIKGVGVKDSVGSGFSAAQTLLGLART